MTSTLSSIGNEKTGLIGDRRTDKQIDSDYAQLYKANCKDIFGSDSDSDDDTCDSSKLKKSEPTAVRAADSDVESESESSSSDSESESSSDSDTDSESSSSSSSDDSSSSSESDSESDHADDTSNLKESGPEPEVILGFLDNFGKARLETTPLRKVGIGT